MGTHTAPRRIDSTTVGRGQIGGSRPALTPSHSVQHSLPCLVLSITQSTSASVELGVLRTEGVKLCSCSRDPEFVQGRGFCSLRISHVPSVCGCRIAVFRAPQPALLLLLTGGSALLSLENVAVVEHNSPLFLSDCRLTLKYQS